jgi:hypothetical protein
MEEDVYKVYHMNAIGPYSGAALIAALDLEEANLYIDSFIDSDRDNSCNSYAFSHVDEDDCIECLSSNEPGIIFNNIWYMG